VYCSRTQEKQNAMQPRFEPGTSCSEVRCSTALIVSSTCSIIFSHLFHNVHTPSPFHDEEKNLPPWLCLVLMTSQLQKITTTNQKTLCQKWIHYSVLTRDGHNKQFYRIKNLICPIWVDPDGYQSWTPKLLHIFSRWFMFRKLHILLECMHCLLIF
jgi:hypothetical protein